MTSVAIVFECLKGGQDLETLIKNVQEDVIGLQIKRSYDDGSKYSFIGKGSPEQIAKLSKLPYVTNLKETTTYTCNV